MNWFLINVASGTLESTRAKAVIHCWLNQSKYVRLAFVHFFVLLVGGAEQAKELYLKEF